MTIDYDEIRAKAEVLAEDAFWGSQDQGSLTSGIVSLVSDALGVSAIPVPLAGSLREASHATACAREELRVVDPPARIYTSASDEPPADVILLLDESVDAPYLHRVGDRWAWSARKSRGEALLSYDEAIPWAEAASLAHNNGTLTEVV